MSTIPLVNLRYPDFENICAALAKDGVAVVLRRTNTANCWRIEADGNLVGVVDFSNHYPDIQFDFPAMLVTK